MWHLDYLSKEQEDEYLNLIFDKVKKKRKEFSNKRTLSDATLKKYLISKPQKLYNLTSTIDKEIIKKIFDYDIITKNKEVSYEIAKLIGVNTCVYCNRQYVFTVDDENNNHITRPEFDHYLPKSIYPFFALSLYNLIPSCHICNSNCKGTEELSKKMNPYLTDKKDYFKFSYDIDKNIFPSSVKIKDIDSQKKVEVTELLQCFKIKEIYDYHTNLELKDLYTFATKYSDTYLRDILNKVGSDFKFSQEEAYRILFGTELLEKKYNDRPLSKFKRDILKELRVIPEISGK